MTGMDERNRRSGEYRRLGWLLLCGLLLCGRPVAAEVYKWVDENGKTHFGDAVPEQYQAQQETLNPEANIVESDLKKGYKPAPPAADPRWTVQPPTLRMPPVRSPVPTAGTGGDCESQWAAYQRAKVCFNHCGTETSSGGRNVSRCACTDVPKPRCKR